MCSCRANHNVESDRNLARSCHPQLDLNQAQIQENARQVQLPPHEQRGEHSVHSIVEGVVGGPDRDRTDDLFHAITSIACNLLILGASVATRSILEHPKTTLSTFASTFKTRKEEVCRFLVPLLIA